MRMLPLLPLLRMPTQHPLPPTVPGLTRRLRPPSTRNLQRNPPKPPLLLLLQQEQEEGAAVMMAFQQQRRWITHGSGNVSLLRLRQLLQPLQHHSPKRLPTWKGAVPSLLALPHPLLRPSYPSLLPSNTSFCRSLGWVLMVSPWKTH